MSQQPSLLIFTIYILCTAFAYRPCNPRQYTFSNGRGTVCVCNATYCDDIQPVGHLDKGQMAVYTSSMAGARFARTNAQFTEEDISDNSTRVGVNALDMHQTVIGFGGAFTDSVGINLRKMGSNMADDIIRGYFGDDGLAYTVGRVVIASCDFSPREYSYLEKPLDFGLKTFNLTEEDYLYKIPYIQRASQLAPQLRLFGTPWSAPAWMKTNGDMKGGGELFQGVGPFYETYAQYFVRFLEEYRRHNISFSWVTPQNEPGTGQFEKWQWQTMYMSAAMQRDWIRDHLGPALRRSPAGEGVGVIILDDQRINLPLFPDQVLSDAAASEFISGIGVHWYLNFIDSPDVLTITHERHPDKFILGTEASTAYKPGENTPHLGDWNRGEQYMDDIISSMNNWMAGWTDWNLVLDMQGGPNWVDNFVDAPIIVNPDKGEYYKQPMYYAMGHFSKFVRPGFARTDIDLPDGLEGISFVDPETLRRVVVLLNQKDSSFSLSLVDSEQPGRSALLHVPARSYVTAVWEDPVA